MDPWRNNRGNKKIPRDRWKYKDPKPIVHNKSTSKKEAYFKKQWKSQKKKKKTNITPKTTRERRTHPKLIEGKKSKRSDQK